jgi:hypothetical protein
MTRFEKWSVWVTSALTAVTGIGYFWTKYLMRTNDPFAVVNSPLEPWFLKAHVLVSPLLVFAVGAITVKHVWRHFRSSLRPGRRSGILTALVVGPMVVTGYLIQVTTGEGWLEAMAITHISASFVYVFGLFLHQTFVQRIPGPTRHRRRNVRPHVPRGLRAGSTQHAPSAKATSPPLP